MSLPIRLLSAVGLLVFVPVVHAHPEVDELRKRFDTTMKEIKDNLPKRLAEEKKRYEQELKRILGNLKDKGKDAVAAEMEAELKRYQKEGTLTPADVKRESNFVLKGLQSNFIQLLDPEYLLKFNSQSQFPQYEFDLKMLFQTFLRNKDLEGMQAIHAEAARVKNEYGRKLNIPPIPPDIAKGGNPEKPTPGVPAEPKEEKPARKSLREGLLGWYSFAKIERDTVKDESGKGNDAALAGAEAESRSRRGPGISCDGKGGTFVLPAEMTTGLKEFTIAFWVRTSYDAKAKGFAKRPTLLGLAESDRSTGRLGVTIDGGMIGLWHTLGNGYKSVLSNKVRIADDKWHHVAVSSRIERNGFKLCVDGVRVFAEGSAGKGLGDQPLHVGGGFQKDKPAFHVPCLVDEVMVWNRGLSEEELARLFGNFK